MCGGRRSPGDGRGSTTWWPNQAWSWDISRLRGPAPRTWFYLYVVLDIYSRKIVGWSVDVVESDAVAQRLVRRACEREGVIATASPCTRTGAPR